MKLKDQLGEEWYELLKHEFKMDYMRKVYNTVRRERLKHVVRPASEDVFKAYRTTPYSKVKTVIVGQDVYPHIHANGLCFSSTESMENPPKSLQNIFKELEDDVGFSIYQNPDLTRWAKQGVFLLNRVLTTRDGLARFHKGIGWERFTEKTIKLLNVRKDPIVYILWGRDAQTLIPTISKKHKILTSPHPSPLSAYRGFFGSKPFSKTNKHLEEMNKEPIDWLRND